MRSGRSAFARSSARFPTLTILEAASAGRPPQEPPEGAGALPHPPQPGRPDQCRKRQPWDREGDRRDRTGTDLVYVAFNLTPLTSEALLKGTMDAVVHQDMAVSARTALGALIRAAGGQPPVFRRHIWRSSCGKTSADKGYRLGMPRVWVNRDCAASLMGAFGAPKPRYRARETTSKKNRSAISPV